MSMKNFITDSLAKRVLDIKEAIETLHSRFFRKPRRTHVIFTRASLKNKLLLSAEIGLTFILLGIAFSAWQTWRAMQYFANKSAAYDIQIMDMPTNVKRPFQGWTNILSGDHTSESLSRHQNNFKNFENPEARIQRRTNNLRFQLDDSETKSLVAPRLIALTTAKARQHIRQSQLNNRTAIPLIIGAEFAPARLFTPGATNAETGSGIPPDAPLMQDWSAAEAGFLVMCLTLLGALAISIFTIRNNILLPASHSPEKTGGPSLGKHGLSDNEMETLGHEFHALPRRIESLVASLKESEEQYRNLLEGIDAIIWKADINTLAITFISRHAETTLGLPFDQWLNEPGGWEKFIHPDDSESCTKNLRKAAQHIGTEECEHRALTADGRVVWLHNRFRAMHDEHGKALGIFGVMVDITARKCLEARMMHLATHDPLTELPNRNLLIDRLEHAMAQARRTRNYVALMFIDLDRFKNINDSLGHGAGDEVLKTVSGRILHCLRSSDTVARLGGDEFAVVLDDADKEDDVADVAKKILLSVSQPLLIDGHELKVGCSIGISLYPNDGEEQKLLLKNADTALYCVKAHGKNNFRFYAEEMNSKALEHLKLEGALHHALERGELLLHYQPQFDLRGNRIVGVEALLRWQKPDVGLVPPADFIGLAEETGLILPIGEWVLRTACMQNKAWQDAGLPHFCVAVNLSALQFMQQDIVTTVRRTLTETQLDPQYLELEITESVLMQDAQLVTRRMHELKQLGIKLAIDDFGTGYSSLSYIKQFPINRLKIDRSFVRDITEDPDDAAIVRAVISMAHNLKIRVIAEGVETEEQQEFLRAYRCNEIQGYYFSKPLPGDEVISVLEAWQKSESPLEDATAPALLLVDDEQYILNALSNSLRRQGYRILKATGAKEALAMLARNKVGVIVSDQRMPEMSGVDFLRLAKQLHPDAVRVVLTGYTDLKAVMDAINEGAVYKFLAKPWENERLRELISEAFVYHEIQQEKNRMAELAATCEPLSPAMYVLAMAG